MFNAGAGVQLCTVEFALLFDFYRELPLLESDYDFDVLDLSLIHI